MLHIGVLQFTLEIPYAETLKDKRNAIKALKDRLRRSFNVSIAEIEDLDSCTIATLGAVVAGSDMAAIVTPARRRPGQALGRPPRTTPR